MATATLWKKVSVPVLEERSSILSGTTALRLMRDLPAENARIKQQLGMLGRDPAEPYGHGRMGYMDGQQARNCQQRWQERRLH